MTIANRPGMTYEFTPEHDYVGDPPVFYLAYLSGIAFAELMDQSKKLDKIKNDDTDALLAAYDGLLRLGLVGWDMIDTKGKAIAFDIDKITGLLLVKEVKQIIAAIYEQLPSMADKKKSNSQLRSSTAKSVKARAKGRKRAKTSRRK